jgi:aryl-alcohol dehydrogenase-like predicted oxidoreductase
MAEAKGCTPPQLALAWVLAKGDDVVPIPGTKRQAYLEQNLAALDVRLSPDDVARLDALFPPGAARGERYGEVAAALLDT